MESNFAFLRSLHFFKNLSDEDLAFLDGRFHREEVPANSVLFYENSVADKFYVIHTGSIEIWKGHGTPSAVRLAVESRGHVFGEMALVDDLPRSATIITHEDSVFLFLYQKEFEAILKERTSLTLAILRSLTTMVRNSNESFLRSLTQQNMALAQAYRDLKDAQGQLIQNERLSNLGKFASFVLHDLRNPLAAIRGYAEVIGLEANDTSVVDFAHKIITEADYLNRFANELLDYSRGAIRLNIKVVNLRDLVAKLESYVVEPMKRRQVDFVVELAYQGLLECDEDRILRALVNICDNARKACSMGGEVRLRVTEDQGILGIEVKDNGEGMNAEVAEKMFEPFYSSSKQGGTGLGMLIVKNVVEAHQGSIRVVSELGRGTSILMYLPLGLASGKAGRSS